MKATDPKFQQTIQNGPVKWAITTDGELSFIPKYVNGEEIPHTVITGGADVYSVGEATIMNNGRGYQLSEAILLLLDASDVLRPQQRVLVLDTPEYWQVVTDRLEQFERDVRPYFHYYSI